MCEFIIARMLPVLLITSIAAAQAPSKEPPATGRFGEGLTVKTVQLKFADAGDLASVLRSALSGVSVTADTRTNTLVICGHDAMVKQGVEVAGELDHEDQSEKTIVQVFPLRFRPAMDVADRLRETIGKGAIQISADQATNAILIRSTRQMIEIATGMIARLDGAAASVPLEFAILHARAPVKDSAATGESDDDGSAILDRAATAVPPDFKDVAAELERFGQLRMLARFTTTGTEGRPFTLEGMVADRFSARIGGMVRNSSADGGINVEVTAEMERQGRTKEESSRKLFSMRTQVVAPRGKTVVIGTVPSGWRAGESAILVVRIGH